ALPAQLAIDQSSCELHRNPIQGIIDVAAFWRMRLPTQEKSMELDAAAAAFRELVSVIKHLRTPATGCPWDLEQDHLSLRPFLIEEAYEALDAMDRGDDGEIRDELGDLLLQVVLHAQIADDRGAFSITEVVEGIARKMVRRHPHVFGS